MNIISNLMEVTHMNIISNLMEGTHVNIISNHMPVPSRAYEIKGIISSHMLAHVHNDALVAQLLSDILSVLAESVRSKLAAARMASCCKVRSTEGT